MITLGEDATPDQIRRFLMKINLRDCKNDKGEYWSPITGDTFKSYYALMGHIGAHLAVRPRSPITQDRAGYVKAIRRGEPPTDEQRQAHRQYMREHRQRMRNEAAE